jgi:ubiquinone/menaquinone biosynthesis C-methylase UbiE
MSDVAHGQRVRALFDTKAAGWPGKYGTDGRLAGRLSELGDAVLALAGPGADVLDLGCGSGELARSLAAGGYRVTGCDIAPRMLDQAAAADPGRLVSWVRLDPGWQTLPFGPASVDVVVAASVLEYVADPVAVLRECARVLRPGGALVCTVPDQGHPVRWLEAVLGLAARAPLAATAGAAWPRLGRYVTYLRISRQRRTARWWRGAAGVAGLQPARPAGTAAGLAGTAAGVAGRRPLRLLAFRRPADTTRPGTASATGLNDNIGGLL